MTQQNDYAAAGRALLAKAREELAQGDLRQASEKGWGAASQMVKAVAQQRGWEHHGHAPLFEVVSRLVQDKGETRLSELFHVANSLHTNFYENWMPADLIESGLQNVTELVEKLDLLLE